MKAPKRVSMTPIAIEGWTIEKTPVGNDTLYTATSRTITRQKLVFNFRNKHSAVSFCQMNPAFKVVI